MAHSRGYPPDPGFALLRMAQGQPALAAQEIDRALEQQVADRVGGSGCSTRQSAFASALETSRVRARVRGARRAGGGLRGRRVHRGRTMLARRDPFCPRRSPRSREARPRRHRGVDGSRAPYEVALARVRLAEILNRAGEPHTARLELQSARIAFRELGAERDEHHASRLLAELEGDAADPSAGRRVEKTFMFTDIEQSTALSAAMGDEEWDRVLRRHDRLLRDAIRDFDGHVVKHEGDGSLPSSTIRRPPSSPRSRSSSAWPSTARTTALLPRSASASTADPRPNATATTSEWR